MKISNLTPLLIFLFSISLFFGCKKENKLPVNPYVGCCGTEPILDSIGTAKFYVPNIFSPDSNGINDFFTLNRNTSSINSIEIVKDFLVTNAEMDTIFYSEEILPNRFGNSVMTLWDPDKKVNSQYGFYEGLFMYSMLLINSEGESKQFSSTACSVVCDEGDNINPRETIEWTGCIWGTQDFGLGYYDTSLPSLENICN